MSEGPVARRLRPSYVAVLADLEQHPWSSQNEVRARVPGAPGNLFQVLAALVASGALDRRMVKTNGWTQRHWTYAVRGTG